jgi:hypothetical protein
MNANLEKTEVKNKNKVLTIQEVQTLYFDEKYLILESGINLRRLDYKGNRNYFTISEQNTLEQIYTSVTTFCKSVLPTSNYLIDWFKNKTKEEQELILKSSSAYGTLMDILFNKLLIEKKLEDISKQVHDFIMIEGLYSVDRDKWADLLKRDCMSFAQFVKDYQVRPILLSCPLKSDSLGIAGTLDLYCEMNEKIPTATEIKKGIEPKRITAIIDYKAKIGDFSLSGERNSFYESECLQLIIYKKLLREWFDLHTDCLMNFSPKNWKTKFSYNLKDWTETETLSNMELKFENYHKNFLIDSGKDSRKITIIEDSISLENFESEIQTYSIEDFINKNLQEDKKNV